jgi:hypothetical protein
MRSILKKMDETLSPFFAEHLLPFEIEKCAWIFVT